MSFTKLSVGNAALGRLGELPVTAIEAASTTSNPSRVLFLQFPFALDELLRAFPWSWAKTRLELSAASPSPLFEWDFAYELPDDVITLIAINELTLCDAGDWWEREGNLLLTDVNGAKLEYIYRPTDSAMDAFLDSMDALARNALVTLWAAKIAPAIVKDGLTKADQLYQRYLTVDLPQARLKAAGESKPPWPVLRQGQDSAYFSSRFGPR